MNSRYMKIQMEPKQTVITEKSYHLQLVENANLKNSDINIRLMGWKNWHKQSSHTGSILRPLAYRSEASCRLYRQPSRGGYTQPVSLEVTLVCFPSHTYTLIG